MGHDITSTEGMWRIWYRYAYRLPMDCLWTASLHRYAYGLPRFNYTPLCRFNYTPALCRLWNQSTWTCSLCCCGGRRCRSRRGRRRSSGLSLGDVRLLSSSKRFVDGEGVLDDRALVVLLCSDELCICHQRHSPHLLPPCAMYIYIYIYICIYILYTCYIHISHTHYIYVQINVYLMIYTYIINICASHHKVMSTASVTSAIARTCCRHVP